MADETKKVGMLEETSGEMSIMRIALFGVVVSTLGIIVVSNLTAIVQALVKGIPINLVDVPSGILGVFTAMVVGKAVQRFGEK